MLKTGIVRATSRVFTRKTSENQNTYSVEHSLFPTRPVSGICLFLQQAKYASQHERHCEHGDADAVLREVSCVQGTVVRGPFGPRLSRSRRCSKNDT